MVDQRPSKPDGQVEFTSRETVDQFVNFVSDRSLFNAGWHQQVAIISHNILAQRDDLYVRVSASDKEKLTEYLLQKLLDWDSSHVMKHFFLGHMQEHLASLEDYEPVEKYIEGDVMAFDPSDPETRRPTPSSRLKRLEKYLPDEETSVYEVAKFLATRIKDDITPEGFFMATWTATLDLARGVTETTKTGDLEPGAPMRLGILEYERIARMTPQIASAIFPRQFAAKVKELIAPEPDQKIRIVGGDVYPSCSPRTIPRRGPDYWERNYPVVERILAQTQASSMPEIGL